MKNEKQNISTAFFTNKIYVSCPKCNELGIVNATSKNNKAIPIGIKANYHCTKCNFRLKENSEWYGYYKGSILQNCKTCGSNLGCHTKAIKQKAPKTKVVCKTCSNENEYEIHYTKYYTGFAIDPYFGMDLWLQTAIKSNVLWAYNLEHLDFLYDYIGSKIRDVKNRHKYSLITNLPNWIKDAKNRDLIVKKLNKLKLDFENIN